MTIVFNFLRRKFTIDSSLQTSSTWVVKVSLESRFIPTSFTDVVPQSLCSAAVTVLVAVLTERFFKLSPCVQTINLILVTIQTKHLFWGHLIGKECYLEICWKSILFFEFFRYASLYFCCAIEQNDNELLTLEIIHRYVELLDKYFGSVSILILQN